MESRVILASQSPRRKELLKRICDRFEMASSGVEEKTAVKEPVQYYSERLARMKALSVAQEYPDCFVIGCDTSVLLGNRILGKPQNRQDAETTLRLLSGKTHQVVTGVCFCYKEKTVSFSQTTQVTFYQLTQPEIARYLETDEPWDKAGAYGIQGAGALFIKGIEGDYYNVVGLPIARCKREWDAFLKNLDEK